MIKVKKFKVLEDIDLFNDYGNDGDDIEVFEDDVIELKEQDEERMVFLIEDKNGNKKRYWQYNYTIEDKIEEIEKDFKWILTITRYSSASSKEELIKNLIEQIENNEFEIDLEEDDLKIEEEQK
jgi:hypothetical protein